jgi:hypothetical protein
LLSGGDDTGARLSKLSHSKQLHAIQADCSRRHSAPKGSPLRRRPEIKLWHILVMAGLLLVSLSLDVVEFVYLRSESIWRSSLFISVVMALILSERLWKRRAQRS